MLETAYLREKAHPVDEIELVQEHGQRLERMTPLSQVGAQVESVR